MLAQIWASILLVFQYLYAVLKTLPRDLIGLRKLLRHHAILKYNDVRKRDFISIFRQNVQQYGSKACFILDDRVLSFQQVRKINLNIQMKTFL